jgi:serine/threonine-protein kinase
LAKSLADYRRDRFESAAQWARKALAGAEPDSWLWTGTTPVLALACLACEPPEQSRVAVSNAIECARTRLVDARDTYFCWNYHESLLANIFLREALAKQRQLLGGQHPEVAQSLNGVAAVLRKQGRFAEAAAMQQEALAIKRKAWPNDPGKWEADLGDLVDALGRAGKLSEAEELFQELLPALSPSRSENVGLLQIRATFFARRGQWREAIANAADGIELDPANHEPYQALASLLVAANDLAGYRQHCQRILARFSAHHDPVVAERMAKACLITAGSGVDLEVVGQMANAALTAGVSNRLFPYFQFAKSLADYRQGKFTEAIQWAQRVLARKVPSVLRAEAGAVLAASQWQVKHPAEARSALAASLELLNSSLPKPGSGDLGGDWKDGIIAQKLALEAQNLIEGPPASRH